MSTALPLIRAKLDRATRHIEEFKRAVDVFHKSDAFVYRAYHESGNRVYRVERIDSVPNDIITIAADVVQNLRTSLDQLARQLVVSARNGVAPNWPVYFPIAGSAKEYPANRKGRLKGVIQAVEGAIDAIEPYRGGRGHRLWQLNELNQAEKHALLFNAQSAEPAIDLRMLIDRVMGETPIAPGKTMRISDLLPPNFLRRPGASAALKAGDVLATEPLADNKPKRRFGFQVVLDVPDATQREPAVYTLEEMHRAVDETVASLGRFLR
jgi:hypothetical protein